MVRARTEPLHGMPPPQHGRTRRQRSRLTELRRHARRGTLTLVYSARDTEHNDAVVLAEVLRRGLPGSETKP